MICLLRGMVLSVIVIANSFLACPATELPDIDTILSRVRTANEARDQQLENSQGHCTMRHLHGSPAVQWKQPSGNSLPSDAENIRWEGDDMISVSWKQRGSQHRFERLHTPRTGLPPHPWISDVNISYDEEVTRIYETADPRGYLQTAPRTEDAEISHTARWFDIDALYHPRQMDPIVCISDFLKRNIQPTIERVLVGGIPCILVGLHEQTGDEKMRQEEVRREFYFAPEMNYALVKAISVKTNTIDGKIETFTGDTWQASYTPARDIENMWALQKVELTERHFSHDMEYEVQFWPEKLEVHLDTEFNSPSDDGDFSFAGLGLPPDAPIFDVRQWGVPVRLYESPEGLRVHPADMYFPDFAHHTLTDANYIAILDRLSKELATKLRRIPSFQQFLNEEIPPGTSHANAFKGLALRRLWPYPSLVAPLMEQLFDDGERSLIFQIVHPHFASARANQWENTTPAAINLVEHTLHDNPDRLTPLHVEALSHAITVHYPGARGLQGEVPVYYHRVIDLMTECLQHPAANIREAAVSYLPTRELPDMGTVTLVRDALTKFLADFGASSGSDDIRTLAGQKLDLLDGVVLVR